MLVRIDNWPRNYEWGDRVALARLRCLPTDNRPQAELWYGDHPESPSFLPDRPEGIGSLPEFLDRQRPGFKLPFLLKLLAAKKPLSLQVHPTLAQARAGFAREEALGIPRDSLLRNYRDPNHKPEMLVCLSQSFDLLCGFAGVLECAQRLEVLPDLPLIRSLRADLVSTNPFSRALKRLLTQTGSEEITRVCRAILSETSAAWVQTVALLSREYPGDAGALASLLMNHLSLRPGQAIYFDAGQLHSYLGGVGVELMASSDNVIRAALTPKHVDVAQLLSLLDFCPRSVDRFYPAVFGPYSKTSVRYFAPPVKDFALIEITPDLRPTNLSLEGVFGLIGLCVEGNFRVAASGQVMVLGPGQAVLSVVVGKSVQIYGEGRFFLAGPNVLTKVAPSP